jgi:adenylate kinase
LGLKVKAIIDAGKLVDDETTIELVKNRLGEEDARKGYILDGFPRTIPQAEALEEFSAVDRVINLTIPDSLALERLGNRRVCRKCGHNFHMVRDRPKQDGICDHCGGEVYTRDDDRAEAIQKRLDIYRAQTAPLVDYYSKKNLLVEIDGTSTVAQSVVDFKAVLGL